ncbi:MAG: efflux RND transporter periplasmic adaptor subunit [candidate division Zixibacteria bacterium]
MRKKTKRYLFLVAILVVIVAVIIGSTTNGDEGTLVQADLAFIDDISEIVTAAGRIQPQTKVEITAEVSAEIIGVFVNEGAQVSKGDRLILLDTVQLRADMLQAQFAYDEMAARTEAARALYEKNKNDYERQSRLFNRQLISETDYSEATFAYENSKANYEAMQAQVKIARSRVEKAADNLAKTVISAPMSGIVTYLNVEVGEIAQAQTSYTQGKRLITISDLSVFEVEVSVDETEVSKIFIGQEAEIRIDAYRDTSFVGSVVEIGNSAMITGEGTEDYSTNFQVKVRFDEMIGNIKPGMSATVDITTDFTSEAVLIPYAAVVTREFHPDTLKRILEEFPASMNSENPEPGEQDEEASNYKPGNRKRDKITCSGVFIINNSKTKFVETATGIADDRHIAVLSGVTPGDTVVSGSYQTLRKLGHEENVKIDETSLDRIKEESQL